MGNVTVVPGRHNRADAAGLWGRQPLTDCPCWASLRSYCSRSRFFSSFVNLRLMPTGEGSELPGPWIPELPSTEPPPPPFEGDWDAGLVGNECPP